MKGGTHTLKNIVKPHTDDIQAIQFEISSSYILFKW